MAGRGCELGPTGDTDTIQRVAVDVTPELRDDRPRCGIDEAARVGFAEDREARRTHGHDDCIEFGVERLGWHGDYFDVGSCRPESFSQEGGERVVAHHEDPAVAHSNARVGELLHRHGTEIAEDIDRRISLVRPRGLDPSGAQRVDIDIDASRIELPRLEHERHNGVGPHPGDHACIERPEMTGVRDDVRCRDQPLGLLGDDLDPFGDAGANREIQRRPSHISDRAIPRVATQREDPTRAGEGGNHRCHDVGATSSFGQDDRTTEIELAFGDGSTDEAKQAFRVQTGRQVHRSWAGSATVDPHMALNDTATPMDRRLLSRDYRDRVGTRPTSQGRVEFDGNVTDDVTGDDGSKLDGAGTGAGEVDGIGEALDPGISTKMRSGLRWSVLSTVFNRLVNPLTGIILARILSPKDFGIFAVALIALNGLNSINELGVTYAVVRWPGDLKLAARTATTIAIASSVLVFIICFIAAPFFAGALHTPEATGVLRLLALGVVIDGIASVPIGLLTRGFLQEKRAAAEWSGFVVSTSVTIGLAIAGFGVWSLAWGRLAGNSVNCAVVYILAPERPRPGWNRSVARDLLKFGIPLTGSSFLVFAMLNVDYLVVGRELGTIALGYYALAFNLSSFPWNMLSTAVRPIAVPAFARFQNDGTRLREIFLRWFHLLMSATVPVCTLLGVLALPLVTMVYGSKWEPAASALVFLAALGGLRVAIDFGYDLFVAVGESRVLVYIQGLWLLCLIPALTIGARSDGIRGVGIAHVAIAGGIIVPVYLFALHRRQGLRPRAVLGAPARPLLGGFLGAVAGVVLMSLFGSDLGQLVAGGLGIVVVYAIVGISVRELRLLPTFLRR